MLAISGTIVLTGKQSEPRINLLYSVIARSKSGQRLPDRFASDD
jgi:hypothetical protein